MAIRSIRHRGLKGLYESGEARALPVAMVRKIADILLAIDEAAQPQDVGLFPVGNCTRSRATGRVSGASRSPATGA